MKKRTSAKTLMAAAALVAILATGFANADVTVTQNQGNSSTHPSVAPTSTSLVFTPIRQLALRVMFRLGIGVFAP